MAESGDGGTKLPLAERVERVGGCLPPTKAVVGEFLASKSATAAVAAAAAAVVAVLMTISCFVSLTPPLPPMLFRLIFIFRPLLLSTVAWCSTCEEEEEVEFFPAEEEEEEEEDEVAPSDAGEAVEAEAVPPTTGAGAANGLPEELLVPRW